MADNPLNSPLNAPVEQEGQVRIELDDSGVDGLYSNLCRVSSTPEEVILDLALNPNPMGAPVQKVRVSQRVILNHFTAKRLAALLTATVQRHEQVFGRLETDIRKRVQNEQPALNSVAIHDPRRWEGSAFPTDLLLVPSCPTVCESQLLPRSPSAPVWSASWGTGSWRSFIPPKAGSPSMESVPTLAAQSPRVRSLAGS